MAQKRRPLREAAAAAVRTPNRGGRMNRNDAMGARFADDVKATIADQMRLPVGKRLSVRLMFDLIRGEYPAYENHYSAFRVWVKDRFGYRGALTPEEEILFNLDDYSPPEE